METKEQRITSAALALFYRHGYSKTTMLDIAEAAGMSRPTLYGLFDNKEAVFAALLGHAGEQYETEARRQVARQKSLKRKLQCLYNVWVIEPFASVIHSENGADLLTNCDVYAPVATNALYARLEAQLAAVLQPSMVRRRNPSAQDLAHILTTATRGLKSTTRSLPELQRMAEGLVTMAVATVGK